MTSVSRMLAGLALAAGLVLSATTAEAAPGHATAYANVRSGPGTGYGVVDHLNKGEYVIVISCGANWCLVHHIGNNGYVSRSLLRNPYYNTGIGKYQFPPHTGTSR
jgi:uncharacterized protein YraI